MPLPLDFEVPGAGLFVHLEAGKTTIFVGANGSGKTRLAATLEQTAGVTAHRIDDAVASGDLPALLRIYDRKDVVLAALAVMKGVKKDTFVSWVGRAMKAANNAGLKAAISAELPAPVAQ